MPEPAENYLSIGRRESLRRQAIRVWAITVLILIVWNLSFTSAPLIRVDSLYRFFGYICHQIPERSLHIFDGQMAVCSRCFGIYFGLLTGVTIYPLWRGLDNIEPISKL